MARILMNHIYKKYGKDKLTVVKDFHLEIKDKEFLVFVGPSGCGKSTTLRMIAGLEDISEGEIYIGDKLINNLPPKDRDIAMVFQNYALYPNMSVYENIAFGLRLRKMPKHEIDLAVKRAARILEIEQYLERKPKQLSGGQRQRVALGRAIVRDPQVFLMDEPLSNLDAKLRVQMRTEIIKLHKSLNATMIYVTHDQIEAMTMGDRIVVMKDGIIQQVDTPENIYSTPANTFVASFIGSPPMNFVEGRIMEMPDGKLEFHTQRFALAIPEGKAHALIQGKQVNKMITLGIRPENVSIDPIMFEAYPKGIIPGQYKLNELMGADRYLHLDIGQSRMLVVRVRPHYRFEEDDKVQVAVDMSKALFFHIDTGERISE
jgi:multiple sugar transport system ATP-binding protein